MRNGNRCVGIWSAPLKIDVSRQVSFPALARSPSISPLTSRRVNRVATSCLTNRCCYSEQPALRPLGHDHGFGYPLALVGGVATRENHHGHTHEHAEDDDHA